MTTQPSPSPRLLAAVAALGGVAWTTSGALLVTDGDAVRQDTLETASAHVAVAAMATALALTVAGLVLLARLIPTSKAPVAAGAGQLLLALACAVTAAQGEDPTWFIAAAPAGNALWLFGSLAMTRALRRTGAVPTAVAVGLPLVWLCAIPLSAVGATVLSGAYWLFVAASTLRTPVPSVAVAHAR